MAFFPNNSPARVCGCSCLHTRVLTGWTDPALWDVCWWKRGGKRLWRYKAFHKKPFLHQNSIETPPRGWRQSYLSKLHQNWMIPKNKGKDLSCKHRFAPWTVVLPCQLRTSFGIWQLYIWSPINLYLPAHTAVGGRGCRSATVRWRILW